MNQHFTKSYKFLGYNIFSGYSKNIFSFSSNKVINTINAYSYVKADSDAVFKNALQSSDILVCDGSGIELVCKIIFRTKIRRITGYEIFTQGLKAANEGANNKVFLFGSSEDNLKTIKEKISENYPNVNCMYLSPAYKEEFNEEDNRQYLSVINNFRPDILFVSLTAPKQEKWVDKVKNNIDALHIASVGAVFDFYSERIKRAPLLMRKLGFEWLYRSIKEPSRLGSRNLYAIPNFFYIVLKKILFK